MSNEIMGRSGEEMKKTGLLLSAMLLLGGCQAADEEKKAEKETTGTAKEEKQVSEASGLQLEAAFFNEVKQVDGKAVITNPENVLALVNKQFALPGDYKPSDLVRPNVPFSFGNQDIEKSYMRKEAAEAMEEMFQAAEKEGIHLFAVSGYRSYERQEQILANQIAEVGEEKALEAVAPPGSSEHQTGLTMDISAESVQFDLVQEFETTTEGQWLAKNAHTFGFILRYPKNKEDITYYMYEPWHFRYVGKEAAKDIFENGWTLEEYFKNVKKI
ncbi:M15 family metallopeptidase [Bacillus sp. REN10]|uniref:M15 family metallopeptidase n=1 Tax=Bacillus sp. REN10 TaxID=2782541 RepID=UPI001EED4186|nr:M15 family metallopeptidase [Bacillus sp. REN10]